MKPIRDTFDEKQQFFKSLQKIFPFIIIIIFILFKFNDLFLPYFWDEAWSYIPAIKAMASEGPSLMPNSISPELYRGHPLMFYFLSSLWINIFGSEIWITKLFSLLISSFLLFCIFNFVNKFFDYISAILTLLFLSIQSVFFVQSTLLLPEILLALFTILSIHSYFSKKYFLTAIWLSLALYTKESGFVIYIIIISYELFGIIFKKNKLKNFVILLIPLFLISIFFFLQKVIVGWFFFPEHLGFISINKFFSQLNSYSSYLFIFMGRNLLSFFGIISLIFIFIKRFKLAKEKKSILIFSLIYIIAFLFFSSINFYSPRYLLSILPFSIMIFIFLIKTVLEKYNKIFIILIFALTLGNNIYFTVNKRKSNDHSLGYRNIVNVQYQMVEYCENQKLYDNPIFTHFLMFNNLTNKDLGYLQNDKIFTKIQTDNSSHFEYVIFSSNELDKDFYNEIKNKYTLVKRFEEKNSWTELYFCKKND